MANFKRLAFTVVGACICLGCGYWLGERQAERQQQIAWIALEGYDVQERINTLDHLYASDTNSAIQRLERWLDRDAIVLGPNEYHPRTLTENEKATLKLISNHREAHPFTQPNHPGINDMVQKALSSNP